MSKIAQSLEHAQMYAVIFGDFRKTCTIVRTRADFCSYILKFPEKTVYRFKHILNHLSLQIAQVL